MRYLHFISTRLATAALLLLTACHRGDTSQPLIFILVPSQDNPFFKAEADAAASRARALGYRVRVDAHDDDAYRQDNLIDAAIASNAKAIVLDNAGADSSIAAVRRATKAGIPCFLIDRAIDADGIAKAQIIADNDQGARIVAAEFVRLLEPARGRLCRALGPGIGYECTSAHKWISCRSRPANEFGARRRPVGELVAVRGFSKDGDNFTGYGNLRGIIAGNDTMALGAAAAVKSTGRSGIIITGFDGSPDAVSAIREGALRATSLQPAVLIAREAVEEAEQISQNREYRQTGAPGCFVRPGDSPECRRLPRLRKDKVN